VSVRVGDAQAPAFGPATFDVVTAGLVLFFLPDPPAALTAYRELLRPGGRLAFSSFAAFDPRYERAMKALAAHTANPERRPRAPGIFRTPETVRAALEAWSDVRITEFTQVSRFAGVEQWMAWLGSHAGRELIRAVPADRLAAATADAGAALDDARADDGTIRLTTTIRVVVASR
jgi:SAM-dependent methyltransferase